MNDEGSDVRSPALEVGGRERNGGDQRAESINKIYAERTLRQEQEVRLLNAPYRVRLCNTVNNLIKPEWTVR